MEKSVSFSITICALVCILISCFYPRLAYEQQQKRRDISKYVAMVQEELTPKDTVDSWDVFYLALTFVESSWDTMAFNPKSGALGLIQAMPEGSRGFIDEANRLLGYDKYSNASRTNASANREMFDIVNYHRNPNLDFDIAIQLHNPGADQTYKCDIMKKYNELRMQYILDPEILYIESKDSCNPMVV